MINVHTNVFQKMLITRFIIYQININQINYKLQNNYLQIVICIVCIMIN